MNIAAIIVGIDGWDQYTLPLVESIEKHQPKCAITVVDNASATPYHLQSWRLNCALVRTERLCYSAAINYGARHIDADWYIVLSNDVLCTGPFAHILAQHTNGDLVGPCLKRVHGYDYLEGWCVAISRRAWDTIGPWEERYIGSSWEDVNYSHRARLAGFGLVEDLPFVHLDQRQRFSIIEDFARTDDHNRELFLREYASVTV